MEECQPFEKERRIARDVGNCADQSVLSDFGNPENPRGKRPVLMYGHPGTEAYG